MSASETVDRTSATDAEFVARLDRFAQGVAHPPEDTVHRIASLMHGFTNGCSFDDEPEWVVASFRDRAVQVIDALKGPALAVLPTQQDDAARVLALADELGTTPGCIHPAEARRRIRHAIAGTDAKGDQP